VTGEVLLRVVDVGKTFTLHLQHGARIEALRGASLDLRAGECVMLHGPSGAGKSTLLRCIYGNYRAGAGAILVRHAGGWTDVASAGPREMLAVRRDTLGHVSQFLRVVPRVSALEIVAEALTVSGTGRSDALRQAGAMLLRLNVPERLHGLPPATFSGGERQRVNLARGFLGRQPILLLDEPTASLDAANRDAVTELVIEAKRRGVAILGIMHDEAARNAVADRLLPVLAPA
jgi:alpha-D-ribose 1-methylphosphonate 5-triphosphate synthase subunit PhnL